MEEAQKIVDDNYTAAEGSFLGDLHERDYFDFQGFSKLCEAAKSLAAEGKTLENAKKIHEIYTQTCLHVSYHFDPDDESRISNLPKNYVELLYELGKLVAIFFNTEL